MFRTTLNGRPYGSFRIDIRTKCVGRIKKSTGVYPRSQNADKKVAGIVEMLKELDESRDVQRLSLIKSGKVKLLDAYQDWQLGRPSFIAAHANDPFITAVSDWIETSGLSEYTNRSRSHMLARLQTLGFATEHTTVRDTPDILRRCRARYEGEGKSATFNQFRSYLLTFLRHYCGYDDDVYIYKHSLKVRTLQLKNVRPHHPLHTFSDFLDLLHIVNPSRGSNATPKTPTDYRSWIAFMVFTGVRPTEFFYGRWERDKETGHIHVLGGKTPNADRVIPSIVWLPPEKRPEFGLGQRLDALDVSYRVRDFRRTYSLWLENAGVPKSRISLYLGHGPRDITSLYQKQRATRHVLDDDRARLLAWIEKQKSTPAKKTKRVWADSTARFVTSLLASSKK